MMFHSILGILIVITYVVGLHAKRTYERGETLSIAISLGFWIINVLYFVLILISTLFEEYAIIVIPLYGTGALVGGLILVAIGLTPMLVGMREFRSIERISGQDVSRLVKTGIYRWNRNAQYSGWFFILFGVSLIGRSGLALLLSTAGFLLFYYFTVRMEESYLDLIFEEEYDLYRATTPRYIEIPKPLKNDVTSSAAEQESHRTSGLSSW